MKPPELSVLQSWYQTSKESARKKHWEWFVIDQFLRGNHNIRGSSEDNTLTIVKTKDVINFPINKIFSTFRAVRAFVTRHKPMVMVEPENSSEEAKIYARRANKLLERDNLLNNFRKINKEWVYYGVKYGVGYRQVGYDQKRKVAIRWSVDPFDLLTGNKYGEIEDAPYLDKTVIRTMGYIKNKFGKDAKDVSPDNELAADEYKKLSLQIAYSQQATAQSIQEDEQTAIVHETWYRLFEKNKLGGTVNKCIWVPGKLLDFEETPLTEYPFVSYKSDIVPNEGVGEGHLKHVIAPQRMLDLLNTQILEYNHIVNRGRYLSDKNAGFKVINSQEGQIIQVNSGKRVQVLNPPSVNPLLERQTQMAENYIEDLGGQHDASMGSTPERVSSGAAIESLQQGDSNNISDLRDNFEDALAEEAAWILKMYSLYENDGIVMNNKVSDEEQETFAVVGQGYKGSKQNPEKYYMEDEGDYCDTCAILPDNQVKVSVTSQLGETREARMDLLFKLVDAGVPLKVVLEHLEFPNISDLYERIAQETMGDMAVEAMKAGINQPPVDPNMMQPQVTQPEVPQEDPQLLQALSGLRDKLKGAVNA